MPSSTTCAIPAIAKAYSLNITVVPPGPLGFVTAYPTGQPLPLAATVNSPQGFIVGNAAIVPAALNGSIDIFASNATNIVLDINGYYAVANDELANTAIGNLALQRNTTGADNIALGVGALRNNISGTFNTATGSFTLGNNSDGSANTANGHQALGNINGSGNVAVGFQAGLNVTSGSNNIHIGTNVRGDPSDDAIIRLGVVGTQKSFFVAGVRGVTTGKNDAIPVVIDSAGQLGTVSSSRRFKEEIQEMGDASRDLMRLRPVTFRYRNPFEDGSKPIQYGLIAEEVAEVYPELVARSADGQIETVKYQVLDSMLLNELQNQSRQLQHQAETIQRLETRLKALEALSSSGTGVPTASPSAGQYH
jgi:hypothetical protein